MHNSSRPTITIDTSELRALLSRVRSNLYSLSAEELVELRKFVAERRNLFSCHSDFDPARRTGNVRIALKPRQELLELLAALGAG